jgi:hypothetical protein
MGKQANLKKLRQSGRGFKHSAVVAGDHNKQLISGKVILNFDDDYTNHNRLIADQYSMGGSPSSNIILVIDRNTGCLAEIIPNERGSIPWEEYQESKQYRQVLSKEIAIAGAFFNPRDPASCAVLVSALSEFMPVKLSKEVLSIIHVGASNGAKWIILKDDSGNICCCLHPDDIKHWNNRRA